MVVVNLDRIGLICAAASFSVTIAGKFLMTGWLDLLECRSMDAKLVTTVILFDFQDQLILRENR